MRMKKTILLFALVGSLCVMGQTPIPTDTYMNFPLNGNATDISGNNYSGTIFGGGITATTDRYGNASGALQFDGSGSNIAIPYSTSVGKADFSISYWANPAESNTGFVFAKNGGVGVEADQFRIGQTGEYFGCFSDHTNPSTLGGGLAFVPTPNVWSYYVATRKGKTITLYVNGVQQSTLVTTDTINHLNTENYRIGSNNGTTYYNGKIDDLQMFKHALSTDEINAIYTLKNNALAFDGVDDEVQAPLATTATDNVTMEAWVNWNGTTTDNQFIVLNGNSSGSGYGIYLNNWNNEGGNKVAILCGGNAVISSEATLTPGIWYHLAAERTSGTWKLFINGNETTLSNNSTASPNTPTDNVLIGASQSGEYFNGSIDEVRIWDVARTQAEIVASAYDIPNPQTATGLIAYYKFDQGTANADNTGITTLTDLSASAHNGTLSNFALTGISSNWINGFLPTILPVVTPPTITTQDISYVNVNDAGVDGDISSLGSQTITQYGFVWSTSQNPTVLLSTKSELGTPTDIGPFNYEINNLSAGTQYYVRAYATTSEGTVYGDELNFTTLVDPNFYPSGNTTVPTWDYQDIISDDSRYVNAANGKNGCVIDD